MNPTEPIENQASEEDDCPLVIVDGPIEDLLRPKHPQSAETSGRAPAPAPKPQAPKPQAPQPQPALSRPVAAQPNLPGTAAAVTPAVVPARPSGAAMARPALPETTVQLSVDAELNVELVGRTHPVSRLCTVACWAIGIALLTLFVVGWSYYTLPASRRPFHALHAALRPSGILGLSLGVAGTATMVASMFYLLRRHTRSGRAGSGVRHWMRFHVLTGIIGPALALFHAGIIPRSAIGGLALLAMLVVVGSGVLGRYILARVPKDLDGAELDDDEVRRRLGVYRQKLEQLGVPTAALDEIEARDGRKGRLAWLLEPVRGVLFGDPGSRRLLKQMRERTRGKQQLSVQARSVLILARRMCHERQWIARYRHLRVILGAWRFLHRWLAVTMFVAIVFHIGVALHYGGLWILGGHG